MGVANSNSESTGNLAISLFCLYELCHKLACQEVSWNGPLNDIGNKNNANTQRKFQGLIE